MLLVAHSRWALCPSGLGRGAGRRTSHKSRSAPPGFESGSFRNALFVTLPDPHQRSGGYPRDTVPNASFRQIQALGALAKERLANPIDILINFLISEKKRYQPSTEKNVS
ncbi:unnamed protein product [Heligmosomoides polygyrus]|uniref:Histone H2A n=1 Tax=Heligmosomoides polygyrus TaxID=6339 RepID=A0A3P8AR58_HELPZ|nr:unnamed protein product [Heligmosomoides polygyrus]